MLCTWACNCTVDSTTGGAQLYCPSAETSQCKILCQHNEEEINEGFKEQQRGRIIAAYNCDAYT